MMIAEVVLKLLMELATPAMRLYEAGTSIERLREGAMLGLQLASTVSRERIAARNGGPVDGSKVLAMRTRDLVAAYRVAGDEPGAALLERLAVSKDLEARSEDDTSRVPIPGSER